MCWSTSQHSVVDGRADRAGDRRVVSRRFEFVSVDPEGAGRAAGWAPYLDLRHASPEEITFLAPVIDGGWVRSDLEDAAVGYGVQLARAHLEEVRRRTVDRVERTTAAVRARLESEIRYWDHRANQLRERELAGKLPRSGMNSANARQRADELQGRLRQRLEALDAERQLSSLPPVVSGRGPGRARRAAFFPARRPRRGRRGAGTRTLCGRAGRGRRRAGHRTRSRAQPGRDAAQ